MLTGMTKPPRTAALPVRPPSYTVPEAAAELRVSTVTLRRWIAQGLVVATRPGKAYLIPSAEVDRLLTPASQR